MDDSLRLFIADGRRLDNSRDAFQPGFFCRSRPVVTGQDFILAGSQFPDDDRLDYPMPFYAFHQILFSFPFV